MSEGLSHITFICADLDRMQAVLEEVLEARCVYASGEEQFSLSEERFFLVGDVWVAIMKGDPVRERSYNHVAFKVDEAQFDDRVARIEAMGLDMRPPRPRVTGEGRSVYFHGPDGHLLELHTGTLEQRLSRYARGREGVA